VRDWSRIRRLKIAGAAVLLALVMAAPARAQNDPNTGALTFTGALDVLPGVPYIFRGIVQETDPKLTMWPYADLGIALYSGDGALRSLGINFGVWNSLQTGSSGLDGPTKRLHYEEDFYATFNFGFGRGVGLGATFTAYSSPNGMFTTVEELSVKVSKSGFLAPYGVLAMELGKTGQADGGVNKGTYLELGIGPSWSIADGAATFAVPVKIGLSLKDYYEGPAGDQKFGFFDVGGLFTLPLGVPGQFGAWNFHAGADILVFPGDDSLLRLLNGGDSSKLVGLFGIGVSY
jgi:hypothetical protein